MKLNTGETMTINRVERVDVKTIVAETESKTMQIEREAAEEHAEVMSLEIELREAEVAEQKRKEAEGRAQEIGNEIAGKSA